MKPLLVDLDGSVIRTDTLYEGLVLATKKMPWVIFLVPFWLLRGKAYLKQKVAQYTDLNVVSLPVNPAVITYLESQNKLDREIVLCTGSWHTIAERFAQAFPFFSKVVATQDGCNLTGSEKAKWAVDAYGEKGFEYLGNEKKDLAIWKHADKVTVVGDANFAEWVGKSVEVSNQINVPGANRFLVFLKAIRIHQWAKNALVFVPLITSHKLFEFNLLFDTVVAFISLGLCASATYLLNDLFDLEADRFHKTKSNRPLASGNMSIPFAVLMVFFLLAIGVLLALTVTLWFVAALFVYLILTVLYSFKLKRLQTIDVITLASLFTIRVIAGAAAIAVEPSFWLLCFSMFMFLSLAMVKRVAELVRLISESGLQDGEKVKGRGYFTVDVIILQCLGAASGFLAVFVFALYINSEEVVRMYYQPKALWLMCPVLGYWIMRVWMLTARNEMNEDPISFAVKDRNSWLAFIAMTLVLSLAMLGPVAIG